MMTARTKKRTPPTTPPTMAARGVLLVLEFVCIGAAVLDDWRVDEEGLEDLLVDDWRMDEEGLEDPLIDEEVLGLEAKVPKEGRYVK
jgi:hypothetical protein